jgi:hypothetical protein
MRREGIAMQAVALSEAARALLRHILQTRRSVVTDGNREAYRELARAGIMYPVTGFRSGPEANFRFTDAGWEWVNGPASPFPSLAGTRAPDR